MTDMWTVVGLDSGLRRIEQAPGGPVVHYIDAAKQGIQVVIEADHVAAVAEAEQLAYVPGALRPLHPEPCRSHRGPCICGELDVARAEALREAREIVVTQLENAEVTFWPVQSTLEHIRDEIDAIIEEPR